MKASKNYSIHTNCAVVMQHCVATHVARYLYNNNIKLLIHRKPINIQTNVIISLIYKDTDYMVLYCLYICLQSIAVEFLHAFVCYNRFICQLC